MNYARIDDNQNEIVQALLAAGCSVQSIAKVGKGCPDLLVGCSGTNILFEVKDGRKKPSARRLTPMEETWLQRWRGLVYVVISKEEAIEIINRIRERTKND